MAVQTIMREIISRKDSKWLLDGIEGVVVKDSAKSLEKSSDADSAESATDSR